MLPARWRRETVTCFACGETVTRDESREYDKYGNRWDRDGKEFERLCKPCDNGLCHQPRRELEALLVDLEADAGGRTQAEFLRWYLTAVEERYGRLEEQ